MVWLIVWGGVAVGVVVLVALALLVRARAERSAGDVADLDVDPLFASGVVFTGAGAALATTIGPMMFWVMGVGLALMAVGASRSHHHDHR